MLAHGLTRNTSPIDDGGGGGGGNGEVSSAFGDHLIVRSPGLSCYRALPFSVPSTGGVVNFAILDSPKTPKALKEFDFIEGILG